MKKIYILCGIMALAAILLGGGYIYYKQKTADTTTPEIIIDQETIECSVEAEQSELLQGVRAVDNKDGDLSDRIMVNDIRIREDSEAGGRLFDVSYVVFDSSNNIATATRTLKYTDYHSPRFSADYELVFTSVSAVNIPKILRVEDCIDGDISSQIMIEMDEAFLNAISAGEYTCTASVTNSLGDTSSIPLTFEVKDADSDDSRPRITLSDYIVYVKKGEFINLQDYLYSIKVDNTDYLLKDFIVDESIIPYEYGYRLSSGDIAMQKNKIKVNSELDTTTPGVYTVTFSYKHPEDGTKGKTRMTVVVEE